MQSSTISIIHRDLVTDLQCYNTLIISANSHLNKNNLPFLKTLLKLRRLNGEIKDIGILFISSNSELYEF